MNSRDTRTYFSRSLLLLALVRFRVREKTTRTRVGAKRHFFYVFFIQTFCSDETTKFPPHYYSQHIQYTRLAFLTRRNARERKNVSSARHTTARICFRRRRRRFIRRGLETTKKLSPIGREERFAPFGIFFDALNVA